MHEMDVKTEIKVAAAAEGIQYFIFKIEELLRRSAEEKNTFKYIRLIFDKIKRIELLGEAQGNLPIQHLAFNTSVALQNIFKYSTNLRQEFYLEVTFLLEAIRALMPEATVATGHHVPNEDDFCDMVGSRPMQASPLLIAPDGQAHGDAEFQDLAMLSAPGSDGNVRNDSAEPAPSPAVNLSTLHEDLPDDAIAKGEDQVDDVHSRLAAQPQGVEKLAARPEHETLHRSAMNESDALHNALDSEKSEGEEINTDDQYFPTSLKKRSDPASTEDAPSGQEKSSDSSHTEIEHGTHLIDDRAEPELESILNEVNSFFNESSQSASVPSHDHLAPETEELPAAPDREMTDEELNWLEALFSDEPIPEHMQPGEMDRPDEGDAVADDSLVGILVSENLFSELDEIDAGCGVDEPAAQAGHKMMRDENRLFVQAESKDPSNDEIANGSPKTGDPGMRASTRLTSTADSAGSENSIERNGEESIIETAAALADEPLSRNEPGLVLMDATSAQRSGGATDWQEELNDLEFQLLTVVQPGISDQHESDDVDGVRGPIADTTGGEPGANGNAVAAVTALADGLDAKNAYDALQESVGADESVQAREKSLADGDADESPSVVFDDELRPDNAAIGLDISRSALKIVVLRRDDDAVDLAHWRIYDLDPDESEEQRLKNVKQLWASFLTAYKQLRKIPVVTSLINNSVLIRYLTLPNMSDANFMKSATLEIQSELFFPEDQVRIFSYPYRAAEAKRSKHRTGILFAIEHRLLDEIITLINTANIRVTRLCLDSLALTQYSADDSADVRAIIDLGAEKVKLVIVQNNEIRLARNIDSYEKSITAEIAEFMGIGLNEAESMKRSLRFDDGGSAGKKFQLALTTVADVNIQNVVYPFYSKLADEIQLTLQYFNSNNEAKVAAVELTGGGSLLPGMDRYLAYCLNLPVTIADIKNRVRVSGKASASSLLRRVSPKLAVAVGLALSHFQPIDFLTHIDLRKKIRIKEPAIKIRLARWFAPTAVLLFLLTVGSLLFLKIQTVRYQKKLETKKAMVQEMMMAVESLKSYQGMKEKLDSQIQNISLLKKQQPRWSSVLKILSQHAPNSLWLNHFNGSYEAIEAEIGDTDLAYGEDAPEDSDESPKPQQTVLNLTLKGQSLEQYQIQDFITRVENDDSYKPIRFSKIMTREIPADRATQFDTDGRVNISGHGR